MTLIVHKPDRFGVCFAAFAAGSRDLDGRFVRDFFQVCFSNRPRFLSEKRSRRVHKQCRSYDESKKPATAAIHREHSSSSFTILYFGFYILNSSLISRNPLLCRRAEVWYMLAHRTPHKG